MLIKSDLRKKKSLWETCNYENHSIAIQSVVYLTFITNLDEKERFNEFQIDDAPYASYTLTLNDASCASSEDRNIISEKYQKNIEKDVWKLRLMLVEG